MIQIIFIFIWLSCFFIVFDSWLITCLGQSRESEDGRLHGPKFPDRIVRRQFRRGILLLERRIPSVSVMLSAGFSWHPFCVTIPDFLSTRRVKQSFRCSTRHVFAVAIRAYPSYWTSDSPTVSVTRSVWLCTPFSALFNRYCNLRWFPAHCALVISPCISLEDQYPLVECTALYTAASVPARKPVNTKPMGQEIGRQKIDPKLIIRRSFLHALARYKVERDHGIKIRYGFPYPSAWEDDTLLFCRCPF